MSDVTGRQIDEAFRTPVRGWDFSWLRDRAVQTRPPWDYATLLRDAAVSGRLLDIDTGGGEFLATVVPFPGSVIATEGYLPNVAVARKRLAPFGIPVVQAESAPDNVDQPSFGTAPARSVLPFASDAFELVMDRHSSYWPSEVWRVLRDRGRFLTQQRSEAGTTGTSWKDLFGRSPHTHGRFTLGFAVAQLEESGFGVVRAEEADTPITFFDLGAVVYYLRLVPWAVAGFDPAADRAALEEIQERIAEAGEFRIRGSHMLIDAVKLNDHDARLR